MQVTIARQLCLDPSTVSNFFMNARRRSIDKWKEDPPHGMSLDDLDDEDLEEMVDDDDDNYCNSPSSPQSTEDMIRHHQQFSLDNHQVTSGCTSVTGSTVLSALGGHGNTTISIQAPTEDDIENHQTSGSTIQQVVQQQHPPGTTLTLTRYPDGTFKAIPISTTGSNSHNNSSTGPTAVLLSSANPAAVVQQLHPNQTSNSLVNHDNLTSTALDL